MSEEEKREMQLQAVRELKRKGVTGIKVELEGTMQRRSVRVNYEACTDCRGDGRIECEDCTGIGWVVDDEGYETDDECESCESIGRVRCSTCVGQGKINVSDKIDFSNDTIAFKWFLDKLSEKLKTKHKSPNMNYASDIYPWLSFMKLYYDGSVDTEVTFTIRLDKVKNIFYIPVIIEVFKEMAEEIGKGLDVRGAGMHTALIFDEDCRYPNTDSFPFDSEEMNNFKRSVQQLLPAFYFLATATKRARPLGYRPPTVGGSGKHTAIGYNGGAIEFRIFDTCYERPEASIDNIVVINNIMKYMSKRYKSPKILEKVGKEEINFGRNEGQTLERFYLQTDKVDALYAGLPLIKPAYYTVDELCAQREFSITKESLLQREENEREAIAVEYAEYSERFAWQVRVRKKQYQAQDIEQIISNMSVEELRSKSVSEIERIASQNISDYMKRFVDSKKSLEVFTKDRLQNIKRQYNGEYTITFN